MTITFKNTGDKKPSLSNPLWDRAKKKYRSLGSKLFGPKEQAEYNQYRDSDFLRKQIVWSLENNLDETLSAPKKRGLFR